MPYLGARPTDVFADRDLNGQKFILDADADTHITADTDDQIDIAIAGADDFQFTANTFTVLSGSTLAVASGATIANSGTATGFGALAGIDDQTSSNDDQLTITDSAVIINEDSDDLDFRVESTNRDYAFFVDAGAFSGVGNVIINNSAASTGHFVVNQSAITIAADSPYAQVHVTNDAAVTVPSGTAAVVASLRVEEPNITATGTVTAASTVYIAAAPTEGTNNYALWVDAGASKFDGTVTIDGQLICSDGSAGAPSITFEGDLDTGFRHSDGNTGNIYVSANGTDVFLYTNGGAGIWNDTLSGSMTQGITINQSANDDEIFTLKSSDVAHGVTHGDGGGLETDSYFAIRKGVNSQGGVLAHSISEASRAFELRGVCTNFDYSDDSTSTAGIIFRTELKNGTTVTNCGADNNIFAIRDFTSTRVLVKGDGDIHAQNTTWATALDSEDDMMALRMLDKAASTKGIIDSAWDSMIGTDWEYLQKIGVAGSNNPNTGEPDMFSIQGIQKLTMGATWYLGQNFMAFLETIEKHMPGIRKEYEEHMLAQSGRPAMLTQAAN